MCGSNYSILTVSLHRHFTHISIKWLCLRIPLFLHLLNLKNETFYFVCDFMFNVASIGCRVEQLIEWAHYIFRIQAKSCVLYWRQKCCDDDKTSPAVLWHNGEHSESSDISLNLRIGSLTTVAKLRLRGNPGKINNNKNHTFRKKEVRFCDCFTFLKILIFVQRIRFHDETDKGKDTVSLYHL